LRTYIYNTINTTGSILDRFVGLLTPHQCIACGFEGSVLCDRCMASAGDTIPSRCAGCHKISDDYKTCQPCRRWLLASNVLVATSYDSLYERLLHELKFECRTQAILPVAQIMYQQLKSFDDYDLLCPVPTAPARIRLRGFDHTLLLTKQLSTLSNRPADKLLKRRSNTRQVGATRKQRLIQLENEFTVIDTEKVKGKRVLLVDDVMTTGASIAATTKALKAAGAKSVSTLLYAQKIS